MKFNVLQSQTSGYVLRINNSRNLCVSRIDGRKLYVTKCNVEDEDQLWAPWSDFSKFELRPYHEIGWGEREADCISQLHHPKDDEVLSVRGVCFYYLLRIATNDLWHSKISNFLLYRCTTADYQEFMKLVIGMSIRECVCTPSCFSNVP